MLLLRAILLCGICFLVGCQGSTMLNPFGPAGPTQVPPPPTGTARRPDPYYRSSLPSRREPQRLSQRVFNSDQDRYRDEAIARRQAPIDDGASYNGRPTNPAYQQPHSDDDLDWRSPPSSFEVPSVGSRPRVRLPDNQGYSQNPTYAQPSPAGMIDRSVRPASAVVPVPNTVNAPQQTRPFGNGYNGWTSGANR